MKRLFFILVIFFLQFTHAQNNIVSKLATKVDPAATSENLKKITLAKDLIELSGAKKLILSNVQSAKHYLERQTKEKNGQESILLKQASEMSKANFLSKKDKIIQDSVDQVAKELASRFTALELQYLISIENYPVFKNYRNFFESDLYFNTSGKALTVAKEIFQEQKTKLEKSSAK